MAAVAPGPGKAAPAPAGPAVLHEYVPPPDEHSGQAWLRRGELPEHIRLDDRLLRRPTASTRRRAGEPRLDERTVMDRETAIAPDRTTTHDGTLNYAATFNPSVVPFKRLVALDSVGSDFKLRIRDRTLRPLPLARRPTPPSHDAFWGSVLLSLRPNRALPLPSVAPDATIVSVSSTPARKLRFFRDSADNYWVRADDAGALQNVRLVFLTDAPRSYFTPLIPPEVTANQVPLALRPRLPIGVQRAAQQVLSHIGVRSATMHRQLQRLIAYFRNFRAGRLSQSSGNTYLDIALSQRGVCRHRAYAFVITAQALGIPARYVFNEAHAFAEVFVPRQGWCRVDLGGASTALDVRNAVDKTVHRPPPDPFPQPSAYATNYSQLSGPVRGLKPSQFPQRKPRQRSLTRFDRSSTEEVRSTPETLSGMAGGPADGTSAGSAVGTAEGADRVDNPLIPPPADKPRQPTQTLVYSSVTSVLRGKQLYVWGSVSSGTNGVAGLRVELFFSRDGRNAFFLGATVTGPSGAYKASLPIPLQVDVGRYRLYAATPGNGSYQPSLSR